jgi:hypothetical protein
LKRQPRIAICPDYKGLRFQRRKSAEICLDGQQGIEARFLTHDLLGMPMRLLAE